MFSSSTNNRKTDNNNRIRRYYYCCSFLVRLVFFGVVSCRAGGGGPPLHSTYDPQTGDWVCNSGYFKTAPLSIHNATCRPCTVIADACYVGWIWTPCTRTADTCCVPWPSLPMGTIYTVRNTCDVIGCAAGYYINYASSSMISSFCIPCEKGFYCPPSQGTTPQQCGINCTTTVQGASSPLDCVQYAGEPFGFSIAYTFSTTATSATAAPFSCPDLLRWITQHGAIQACSLSPALSAGIATVACTVAASRCVAGDFLQWALQAQDPSQDARALAACLQDDSLTLITAWPSIQQMGQLQPPSSFSNTRQSWLVAPNVSDLVIEPHKWGSEHGQTFSTYVLAAVLISGLGSGAFAAVALAYTRWYRRNLLSEAFHHSSALLQRHKRAFSKA